MTEPNHRVIALAALVEALQRDARELLLLSAEGLEERIAAQANLVRACYEALKNELPVESHEIRDQIRCLAAALTRSVRLYGIVLRAAIRSNGALLDTISRYADVRLPHGGV